MLAAPHVAANVKDNTRRLTAHYVHLLLALRMVQSGCRLVFATSHAVACSPASCLTTSWMCTLQLLVKQYSWLEFARYRLVDDISPQSNLCHHGIIKCTPRSIRHQHNGHVMAPIVAEHAAKAIHVLPATQLSVHVAEVQLLHPSSIVRKCIAPTQMQNTYNCFLNVIVQCLWRCGSFRRAVMQWPQAVFQVRKAAALIIVCCLLCSLMLCDKQACVTTTAASSETCIKL